MDSYKYKAKDGNGKVFRGKLQANDEIDLHNRLKEDGKYLIEYKKEVQKTHFKKLKSDKIAEFSRSIGKLIGAGVSLVRALKITSEDESISPKEREIYVSLLKNVKTGMSLSDAMLMQGDTFPSLFINMYKSAEASGNLDKVALQMADYYTKDHRLMQKVNGAMTYPKILSVMIVAVVSIIMGYVIPQFEDLFAQMERLPLPTTILLGISDFVVEQWQIIIVVVVAVFFVIKIVVTVPSVRYYLDQTEIKLPVIGKLKKIIYTARFARTLSSLYSAGIPIISCLQIARNTIGNLYIEKQFDEVLAGVKKGESLSEALDHVDGFTKKLTSSIMVGEETGSLDSMLFSMAEQMEYDSEIAVNKLVAMLEPAMIVIMAVIVGFIIISVITPIYGSYDAIASSAQ